MATLWSGVGQFAPDIPFRSQHAFVGQQYWASTVEAFGRIGTMKHNGDVVVAGPATRVIEVDHLWSSRSIKSVMIVFDTPAVEPDLARCRAVVPEWKRVHNISRIFSPGHTW